MSLRVHPIRAVVALTAVAILAVAAFSALLLWNLYGKEIAHARGETVSLSHILAEQTARSIHNVDLAMQNMQIVLGEQLAAGASLDGQAVHDELRSRLSGMPQIRGIFIVDGAGQLANSSRRFPSTRYSLADRGYFQAHLDEPQRGLYFGVPTRGRDDGVWTAHLSRRLAGPKGEFRGVIAVALDLRHFAELYDSIRFDSVGYISLHLADGTMLAGRPYDEAAIGKRSADAQPPWFATGEQRTLDEVGAAGERRVVTYHRISEFPLMIRVAIDAEAIVAEWWDKSRFVVGVAVLAILFILAAAWVLARQTKKEEALAAELRESGARLQATVDATMDAVVIAGADQRILVFNPAAEKMFGCKAKDAIGAPLERFVPERYRPAHHRHVEDFGASGVAARSMAPQMEIVGLRADGAEFPVEATISQIKLNGATLYTAILRDITERALAQERLVESNRQLRALAASLQHVREEERSRIARELHDELGQQLTGLKMDMSWLGGRLGEAQDEQAKKVGTMKQQVDAIVKSVRRIATELRPTLLDDLGLGAAIEWLAQDFSRRTGMSVDLDLADEKLARGDELVTALFRIVQECLTNVTKHAEATHVSISLRRVGDALELAVADNGKGMADPGRARNGSHGMIGIRERATLLNAVAIVSSGPGAGMEVRVAVPLAVTEEADT